MEGSVLQFMWVRCKRRKQMPYLGSFCGFDPCSFHQTSFPPQPSLAREKRQGNLEDYRTTKPEGGLGDSGKNKQT